MAEPTWVVMPILASPDLTRTAIASVLGQTVPIRLLLVNQGVDDAFREELEQIAEEYATYLLLWSHQPPLPSLAATWNAGLGFAWTSGAEEALVVNNDVELHPETVSILRTVLRANQALFVSCVGVTEQEFRTFSLRDELSRLWEQISGEVPNNVGIVPPAGRGGPDFSCFLISRECHLQYQFDEHFTPAFCEDLDYHRRLMLAGEGTRIFSVNLPYLHHGSQTLKSVDPKERQRIERAIESGSRAYYQKKWGGPVNQETYLQPFGGGFSEPAKVEDGTATTPYLQTHLPSVDPLSGTISPTMGKPFTAPLEGPDGQTS